MEVGAERSGGGPSPAGRLRRLSCPGAPPPTSKVLVPRVQSPVFETQFPRERTRQAGSSTWASVSPRSEAGGGGRMASRTPTSEPSLQFGGSAAPSIPGRQLLFHSPSQVPGETEAPAGGTSPAARGRPGRPPHISPRPQRGGDGAGNARGPHRGPGSRPPAASPSARASSGCFPRRTPARRWLTAPCGAADERARGRAGPGRAGGGAAGPRLRRAMLGPAAGSRSPSPGRARARARAHTPSRSLTPTTFHF